MGYLICSDCKEKVDVSKLEPEDRDIYNNFVYTCPYCGGDVWENRHG